MIAAVIVSGRYLRRADLDKMLAAWKPQRVANRKICGTTQSEI